MPVYPGALRIADGPDNEFLSIPPQYTTFCECKLFRPKQLHARDYQ